MTCNGDAAMNDCDVLILGAGVAGLTAAATLSSHLRVIVLEARDRVGGRIHTLRPTGSEIPIELGPEFIHGHAPQTFTRLREAGLLAYEVAESHLDATDGPPSDRGEELWAEVEKVMERLESLKHDMNFREFLDTHGRDLSLEARRMAIAYIEGFNAADKDRISSFSLRDAAREEEKIGDTQFRLIGGYDRLPLSLAANVRSPSRIELNTHVSRVLWTAAGVAIDAIGPAGPCRYTAPRVIVALPLSTLQHRDGQRPAVRFEPPLPVQELLDRDLAMGPVTKIMLRCREPFWESLGYDELSFVHANDQPFPTWWTTRPLRTNLLTGWAGGPTALRLPSHPAEVFRLALQSLAAIFRVEVDAIATKIDAHVVTDWQHDPLAGGAYSYATVGGSEAPARLAEPIDGVLFFAGEHTHTGLMGTVAGAIESGQRAAEAVLAAHAIGPGLTR